ncbi:Rhodanese domain protein [Arthrobacter sp. FB24]|jgi:rhodanese-related sulfurtransferase|uniref:rhodanese-like domain-containing protein n=1 Tax=Arthrobacter sp. (strain FB24) TaxID=290399 RepID=UPI00005267D3|nr:rhodanese-like domain-containing protein [Arthrobacter sp. FB24]ABK05213.1 Rhodanese domain protein [Arthrobacter sp. FB24]
MRSITPGDLAAIWPRTVVVDVRRQDEYAVAHIPGSLNIPLDELPFRQQDLPNSTLYVLCGSGKRSSKATALLTAQGHDAVNIAGGITEWYREGHPVSYAPPAPDELPSGRWRSALEKLANWRGRSTG